jgi:hypothetical protein
MSERYKASLQIQFISTGRLVVDRKLRRIAVVKIIDLVVWESLHYADRP